ncbi:asparagine synthase (glutamine-hydrolyzing) [Clostridium botulinum]|uniref:asparagine synthase (glutamine-hydrolyzing) n=2 Tax=Clostridium botulinum TaxID=1491 RepID=A0A0A0IEZ7_CLOBO|nr:asparagine synthase (glutamine-hydrolyzing) [Clostridium botulinum]KGM98851.1 asparagine synthase [Clostridium botulinum C/D str. DC5]KOC55557.1 asparagine synthase [Clostridium botulinum]KOC56353.1 asparagine synthase [Clostridium botulinum]MCD3233813.1 asparagine synthase (glutamine-hydrolyzing) [Clostridium botulinum D/C]MCD3239574.1 asparagine synthase (glutamine-hydrolyzing) [Clostridium botulinum D/C]
MCGFLTYFTDKPISKDCIKNLNQLKDLMEHRGPDSNTFFTDSNIYLGFRRLSITAIESGQQPMSYDNNNYRIVFNGEIYNYKELKHELESLGYSFITDSEAEIILAAYKHFNESFVPMLRGMFSFVIWDKYNNCIFAARDPFGIKPFYYLEQENSLICSSEFKILYNLLEKNKNIDLEGLHNYFTFQYVPEPKTIIENINILPPGHTLKKYIFSDAKIKCYHSINFESKPGNTQAKLDNIFSSVKNSIKAHIPTEVPLGTFLSGGVDSTIITTLAKNFNPNIKSFTVGFKENGFNEISLAKNTADKLGIENINKIISAEDVINEITNIVNLMDVPVADPAAIPLYFVSKEAKKHVKVILSGEGADELFAGYNIYNEPHSLSIFNNMPKKLKNILLNISNILPEGTKGKSFIQRGVTPIEKRFIGNAKIFLENEKKLLLKNYNDNFHYTKVTKPFYDKASNLDDITKMQYIDIETWLKGDILTVADKMTMAHSLELRVPFLDYKVLQCAKVLSPEDKLNFNTTKYLFREAFRDIIPNNFINRKKLGFPVPINNWLKNELYDWAKSLLNENITEEYINKNYALNLLEKHRKGNVNYSRHLWTIIIFTLWYKNNFENFQISLVV